MGCLKSKLTSNVTPMYVRKVALHTLRVCVEESLVLCSLANVYYLLGWHAICTPCCMVKDACIHDICGWFSSWNI